MGEMNLDDLVNKMREEGHLQGVDQETALRRVAKGRAMVHVATERVKQDEEFGVQIHDPAYWLAILGKQVGQLGEAIIKHKWRGDFVPKQRTMEDMYHEARQVAAVAVALMEAIAMDELSDEVTSTRPKDPRKLARALGVDDEAVHSHESVQE